MEKYNKFDSGEPTIETYCRRYDFSSMQPLGVKCNLTDKIKEEHNIKPEEDCIYRSGDHCMNIDKR